MAIMDHWHPVLASSDLKAKPVAVQLCGQEVVLFRTPDQLGALHNCCPHRRMKLSLGQVCGDRLQCKYHGWTFDCDGNGESPGTPKLHATADRFDVCEKHGVIWVKSVRSRPRFPVFQPPGYYHFATLFHQVNAPLELVVDNFTEIEHTPTTHGVFGYDLERMHEVDVRFEPTEDSVRVINVGPQKRVSPILRLLMGIGTDYQFNDDWVTYFSPVYSIYDHWWTHPQTKQEGRVRFRIVIFFHPVHDQRTAVTTFGYVKSTYPGPYGGVRLFKNQLAKILAHEVWLDVEILENLADKNPNITGMKLSRFDRVLGLNRERIERIYRGRDLPLSA